MLIVYAQLIILLHDQFTCRIRKRKLLISLHFLTHAAIQVQFLQNTSIVDEGDSAIPLTVQLQLTPPGATFQYDIIISLSVSSDSATGTVHEQLNIIRCPLHCLDTCCEVVLSKYSM